MSEFDYAESIPNGRGERYTVHLDNIVRDGKLVNPHWVGRCAVANGCFDVLHPGHLSLLAHLDTVAYQRKLRPLILMNSDYSVKRLKGERRPIVPQESRACLLNLLKWPLTVVIFDEDTPQRAMDLLQPVVVVKGDEYPKDAVIRWKDSEVVSVPMVPRWSTSGIVGDTR